MFIKTNLEYLLYCLFNFVVNQTKKCEAKVKNIILIIIKGNCMNFAYKTILNIKSIPECLDIILIRVIIINKYYIMINYLIVIVNIYSKVRKYSIMIIRKVFIMKIYFILIKY